MKIWIGCTEENDIVAFSTYEKAVDYMKNEYMKELFKVPKFELSNDDREQNFCCFHIWDEMEDDYGYFYYIFPMELDSGYVEHL